MAEAAERKLRDAIDDMLDDIDKSYMRRMQVRREVEHVLLVSHLMLMRGKDTRN